MRVFTVDAFTDLPFGGNPAAVVSLEKELPEDMMQKIASEINLSETAFVLKSESSWNTCQKFGLRWFTPTNEVPLCGHATLATAHIIFSELGNASSLLKFDTLSGMLTARRENDEIMLDLPSMPPAAVEKDEELKKLIQAVTHGLPVVEISHNATSKKLVVCLSNDVTRTQLEAIDVDFSSLAEHDGSRVQGIIVTLRGSDGYDVFSRYFAPWNGIPEDPVTGSAHSVLTPFWTKKLNKTTIKCRQCSGRGGDLTATIRGERVDISGKAVTVFDGNLRNI